MNSGVKKVLVAGGGPAGLEAARVAALRGHDVTLMEKERELGGYAAIAALPIGKDDIKTRLLDWLERQCTKAGVRLELNKEVTMKTVKQVNPDVVIIATGGKPYIPSIPGIEKNHVVTAEDVLKRKVRVGKRVVVAGGGEVGVETADFIVENKLAKSVTVLEMLPILASDMPAMPRTFFLEVVLPKWGIKTFTGIKIQEITDAEVIAIDKDWKTYAFEADTVVNAMGYVANAGLEEALRGKVPEVYVVGDCVQPRNLLYAIHEAAYVARQI
jgi:2-enoate reductase